MYIGPHSLPASRRSSSAQPADALNVRTRHGSVGRCQADVDEMVISLSAKGLTTCEVQAHPAEAHGAEVSRQTISALTDKFHVKIRDGAVANRPIYVALAVTADGRREPRPR